MVNTHTKQHTPFFNELVNFNSTCALILFTMCAQPCELYAKHSSHLREIHFASNVYMNTFFTFNNNNKLIALATATAATAAVTTSAAPSTASTATIIVIIMCKEHRFKLQKH